MLYEVITRSGRYYNAVIGLGSIDASGAQRYRFGEGNRYYKYHLLPIGEFVPLQSWLRPIAPFFNLPMSSFSRGEARQPNLLSQGYRFATAICYEIAFVITSYSIHYTKLYEGRQRSAPEARRPGLGFAMGLAPTSPCGTAAGSGEAPCSRRSKQRSPRSGISST